MARTEQQQRPSPKAPAPTRPPPAGGHRREVRRHVQHCQEQPRDAQSQLMSAQHFATLKDRHKRQHQVRAKRPQPHAENEPAVTGTTEGRQKRRESAERGARSAGSLSPALRAPRSTLRIGGSGTRRYMSMSAIPK